MGPDEEFDLWVDTEAFLAVMHESYPDGPDDEAWLELGYRVCDSMASFQQQGMSMDDWLFNQIQAEDGLMMAGVSGAVAATLCSELADWVFNSSPVTEQVCGEREAVPCAPDCSSTCMPYVTDDE